MDVYKAFLFLSVLCHSGISQGISQIMPASESRRNAFTFRFIEVGAFFKLQIQITPLTERETFISIPCKNIYQQRVTSDSKFFVVKRCNTLDIFSTADVSVHGMVFTSVGITGGFLALPHDQLGNEYLIDCYQPRGLRAQVALSAVYNDTTISVDCANNCTFNSRSISGHIKLEAGESGILKNSEIGAEMTGTYIRSDKSISVVVGAFSVYIPSDHNEPGFILEQLLPISSWGLFHIVPSFKEMPNGWILRILAINANTNIAMTGCGDNATRSTILQSREYTDITVNRQTTTLCIVEANQPVQVMQYMASSDDDQYGDPSMNIIPPVMDYHGNTTILINDANIYGPNTRYVVDIVISCQEKNMVHINGSLVPASKWDCVSLTINDRTFCHSSIELQNGTYHITHQQQSGRFWVRIYTLQKTVGAVMLADIRTAAETNEYLLEDYCVGKDTNEVLVNIAHAVVTANNVTDYSYDIAEATANNADINAEGIRAVADALQKIVNIRNPSTEVTSNTIQIIDNILSAPDEDFVAAVDVKASTRILDFLEQQITLHQTEGDGNNLTIIRSSVAVVALQVPQASFREGLGFATIASPDEEEKSNVLNDLNQNTTLVYFDPYDIPRTVIDASIILPAEILNAIPVDSLVNGSVPVTFLIFQTSKLFVSSDQAYELRDGSRMNIGSRIISATVEGVAIRGLPQGSEVVTAFLELNVTGYSKTFDHRTCVFWEKTERGGFWSSKGCRREDIPDTNRIQCFCDHLTSFAVLLDVSGDVGIFALDMFGTVGCIISIICLVITIVTLLSMKKLRSKQPQRILINMCSTLLGLYIVFVIGIDRRYPTIGCVIVGFLIHFFLLSSMSWMLVEAVNMYLLFVKVLDANVSHFMLKASLGAYGLPLIVCIITVAVDTSHYLGDGTYCFVQPGPVLYYGVLMIVALILVINFVFFGIIIQRLSCPKSMSAHKTSQVSSRDEMSRRVQNAVVISLLLGFTWLFGFLAIGGARIISNILFLVFNSLQGFFIFLMFCVRQKDFREQWVRWVHCDFGEVTAGQRSRDINVKYKKTGSQDGRMSIATSTSQGIQPSSGGTLSTNEPSVTI